MITGDAISALANQVDNVFALIGLALFLIELAEAAFKRNMNLRLIGEMLVSASTQIPFLLVQTFILTGAYSVYWILAETVVPFAIETTVWTVALALIIADLIYYWEHRIAHEVRILWTQHAVHHSSRDMNMITGIRFGPLEGVWGMIAYLPMVLIGFDPWVVVSSSIVVLAYQTWLHTELIGKLGALERVLNTPSHHRVHHGSDAKYLDRNYGGILIIWDRMFGSFQVEEETPRYGLVRDFDSRNPVAVWFSEWPQLIRDVAAAGSLRNAWKRLFERPGEDHGQAPGE
jgi:sterol desaturase/sphingolipid hydroxylase (fatty acid hydroxylase superfamily)